MSSLSEVHAKFMEFNKQHELIETKRNQWKNLAKPIIIEEFNSIAGAIGHVWGVSENNDKINMQSVALYIPDKPSGITEVGYTGDKPTHGKHFMKIGGYLLFSQTTNGQIVVVIVYPYIQELTSQKPHEVLGFYTPGKIDSNFVRDKVIKFIDEMIDWEVNENPKREDDKNEEVGTFEKYVPIGFKQKELPS